MKVLVAAGASGGHIFPAVSFLRALQEEMPGPLPAGGIDGLLAIPKNSLQGWLPPEGCKVKYLSISSIRLLPDLRNLAALFRLIKGAWESLFLLLEFRPDMVAGFGGLNSVPPLLLAWALRIKTLIHEQNVIPGRANRLLARFADKVAVSFSETKDYLKINPKKIIVTGNPIRRELKMIGKEQALDFFGFRGGKFTVLVMGGSRGSHRINACFLEAVSLIADRGLFQFIHIAGARDRPALEDSYRDLGVQARVFSFLGEMQYAYSASDLAVCRAGATTIAELAFFALPAVIIPYPFAYQHQAANAAALEGKGAAVVIREDKLGARLLKGALLDFLAQPDRLESMRLGYGGILKSDAGGLLARQALNV